MDATTVFWYVGGIVVLLLAIVVLAKPLEIGFKLLGSSLVGGAVLWVLNQAGSLISFHLALNPVSALIVGLLGVPGVVTLGLMKLILHA
jgi:inhibitor of the pro-sigma K processing machinery